MKKAKNSDKKIMLASFFKKTKEKNFKRERKKICFKELPGSWSSLAVLVATLGRGKS